MSNTVSTIAEEEDDTPQIKSSSAREAIAARSREALLRHQERMARKKAEAETKAPSPSFKFN
jgi:hypothetical protein